LAWFLEELVAYNWGQGLWSLLIKRRGIKLWSLKSKGLCSISHSCTRGKTNLLLYSRCNSLYLFFSFYLRLYLSILWYQLGLFVLAYTTPFLLMLKSCICLLHWWFLVVVWCGSSLSNFLFFILSHFDIYSFRVFVCAKSWKFYQCDRI
jgi:hypothetical protein